MSPENQDKVVKVGGAILLAVVVIVAAKLLKGETELLVGIVTLLSGAYGVLGFNTPLGGVRKAAGLVSTRAPSPTDVAKMKAAVQVHESQMPPASEDDTL